MTKTNTLIISGSSIEKFRRCPRCFAGIYFTDVDTDDNFSYPANAGTAIHAGFQSWIEHKDKDMAIWSAITNYEDRLNTPIQYSLYSVINTVDYLTDKFNEDYWALGKINGRVAIAQTIWKRKR